MPLKLTASLLSPSLKQEIVTISLGEHSVRLLMTEIDRGRLGSLMGTYSTALDELISLPKETSASGRAGALALVGEAEDALVSSICAGWPHGEICTHEGHPVPSPEHGKDRAAFFRQIGIFDPVLRACVAFARGERPTTAGQ